jgi:predicted RNase H-like HicB family nuclease
VENTIKALKAMRIKIKIGDMWKSPYLHVLLTWEDEVFVIRCLDFTVSSHGKDEKDALNSLAEALKEYILTSIENSNIKNLYDPAHNKYWRVFNELETRQLSKNLKRSLSKSRLMEFPEEIKKQTVNLQYA